MLVIVLFPDHSLALLRAAVTHDAAEFVVGDLSQPFKAVGGGLVADHASLEGDVLTRMGLACDLSEFEQRCLKLIDRIGRGSVCPAARTARGAAQRLAGNARLVSG